MGGGSELPIRGAAKEKELVICTLNYPKEDAKKVVEKLKKELDVDVEYFWTKLEVGKPHWVDVPEGMLLLRTTVVRRLRLGHYQH